MGSGYIEYCIRWLDKIYKGKFNFWPKNILYTLRNVVIRHYIGKKKPWKLCKVASRDVWEKYSQNSLWADIPMEEPIAIPQNYRLIKEVSKYYFCKNNISNGIKYYLKYLKLKAAFKVRK